MLREDDGQPEQNSSFIFVTASPRCTPLGRIEYDSVHLSSGKCLCCQPGSPRWEGTRAARWTRSTAPGPP